jgi:hypothetical protein
VGRQGFLIQMAIAVGAFLLSADLYAQSTDTRKLRRAALALAGRLPTLQEYQALREGQKSYSQFVADYARSEGFRERVLRNLAPSFLNKLVSDSDIQRLRIQDYTTPDNLGQGWDLGGGVFVRKRGLLANSYPDRRIIDGFGNDWGPIPPLRGITGQKYQIELSSCATPEACVLEMPFKSMWVAGLQGRCRLVNQHYGNWQTGTLPAPTLAPGAPDCELSGVRSALGMDGYAPFTHFSFHSSSLLNEPGTLFLVEAVQKLPGYYAGCLLPGDAQAIASGAQRIDANGELLRADALPALPVRPWWAPDTTVYVCPGVAPEHAFALGAALDPRLATPPTSLDLAYPNLFFYNVTRSGRTVRMANPCTAWNPDVGLNPLCGAGPNLRNILPNRQLAQKAITHQIFAAFDLVTRGDRPYKDLLQGRILFTNRILQWIDYWKHLEARIWEPYVNPSGSQATIRDGWGVLNNLSSPGYPEGRSATTIERPDFDQMMAGLPSVYQENWRQANLLEENYTQASLDARWNTYAIRSGNGSVDPAGLLTTLGLTFAKPSLRGRAYLVDTFFQCTDITAIPIPVAAPVVPGATTPILNPNCVSCHSRLDPLAGFFSGTWGRDNPNFIEPVAGNGTGATSPLFHQTGRVGGGQVFRPLSEILTMHTTLSSRTPRHTEMLERPFGIDPRSDQIWSFGGQAAQSEHRGLAQVLGAEPQFTRCASQRMWKVLLGRAPSTQEVQELEPVVLDLSQSNYSPRALAEALANTATFRRAP